MPSKKLTGSQLRNFRSDVAALKSKGLVSKRKDARTQKPTRYMRGQIEKFRDVLEGKATVLHVPARKAKGFSEQFRVKGKAVVVPHEAGETIRYNPNTNTVTGTRRVGDKRVRKEFFGADFTSAQRIPNLKPGQLYQIQFGGGQIFRWDNREDMIAFMHPYEAKPKNPFKNWYKYIAIVSVDNAGDGDEE